jgi:L-threonylcarbamoyladenylate synthase
MLRKVLPSIQVYSKETAGVDLEEKPPTPGLKYRHYSPTASLILYEGQLSNIRSRLSEDLEKYKSQGKKVGLIHTRTALDLQEPLKSLPTIHLGDEKHPLQVAQGLFAALRSFDDQGIDVILMEGIDEQDEGLAVMNRARKAASTIVQV